MQLVLPLNMFLDNHSMGSAHLNPPDSAAQRAVVFLLANVFLKDRFYAFHTFARKWELSFYCSKGNLENTPSAAISIETNDIFAWCQTSAAEKPLGTE